jgi:hypothetical protein
MCSFLLLPQVKQESKKSNTKAVSHSEMQNVHSTKVAKFTVNIAAHVTCNSQQIKNKLI